MKSGEGFLCVFDLTSKESFEVVTSLMEDVVRLQGSTSVPMVLVGNKIDLKGRQVTPPEAQDLADKYHCEYFEAAAATGQNVELAFYALVRAIRKKQGHGSSSGEDKLTDKKTKRKSDNKCVIL